MVTMPFVETLRRHKQLFDKNTSSAFKRCLIVSINTIKDLYANVELIDIGSDYLKVKTDQGKMWLVRIEHIVDISYVEEEGKL